MLFLALVSFTWNRLPADVVEAASTEVFKRKFDEHACSKGGIVTEALFY